MICYGQNNLMNSPNIFGNNLGMMGLQNDSVNNKNLASGNSNIIPFNFQQQGNQQLLNPQSLSVQSALPFNMPQQTTQPIALDQITIPPISNLTPQQLPYNIQQNPTALTYNPQMPQNIQSIDIPPMNLNTFNPPQTPVVRQLVTQPIPFQMGDIAQPSIQTQYQLQTPQSYTAFLPSSPLPLIPNYGQPHIISTVPGCLPSGIIPLSVIESPQLYKSLPTSNPYSPYSSFPGYSIGFEPTQNVMMSQRPNLLSILQSPTNIPNNNMESCPINTVIRSENPSSSSAGLKSLLPIIINLLKEKSNGCGCRNCNCDNKKKRGGKPPLSSYSKQKNSPLNGNGPLIEEICEELEAPRKVRDSKVAGKLKNKIPVNSDESNENESVEYDENEDD